MYPIPSPEDVMLATLRVTGLNTDDMVGKSRMAPIVRARAAYAWVTHENCGHSYPVSSRPLGRASHTTCIEARNRAALCRTNDQTFVVLCSNIYKEALVYASRGGQSLGLGGMPEATERLIRVVNKADPRGCTSEPASDEQLAEAVRAATRTG